MGRLSIAYEKHNISNITWNSQGLKTGIFRIGDKDSPDFSCMVATQVTDIYVGLAFQGNLKKIASYWIHLNNPLPEKMKDNTQL